MIAWFRRKRPAPPTNPILMGISRADLLVASYNNRSKGADRLCDKAPEMTTTPAEPLVPDLVPITLDVAILHRDLNQAKRNLTESLELFRTVALDVAHMTETVERKEAELAAARAVTL